MFVDLQVFASCICLGRTSHLDYPEFDANYHIDRRCSYYLEIKDGVTMSMKKTIGLLFAFRCLDMASE